jgi:putative transcriptional regulator
MGAPTANFTHHFLIAMPAMADPHFSHTLTYVCEHSAEGALGIVVNKPTDMTLSALFEKIDVPLGNAALRRMPVHFGGPVQVDRGFVLHRPLGNWQSTLADRRRGRAHDVEGCARSGRARRGPEGRAGVAGYAGWSAGQLEQEIAQNAWLTVAADPGVCSKRPSRRGSRRHAPARHRFLASVRRCRTRMTRGVARPTTKPRSSRSISARAGSALRSAT